jgi:hypothetical protein
VATFTATDSRNQSTSITIAITVTKANQAPVMKSIPPQSVVHLDYVSFTVSATDPDGDPLTFRADALGPPPQGATFDPLTRLFWWVPAISQLGNYQVGFAASDGALEDLEVADIAVLPMSLAFHDILLEDGSVHLTYSKNFETCLHLIAQDFVTVLHVQNIYCTKGDGITKVYPQSTFKRPLVPGETVYLCHGNYKTKSACGVLTIRTNNNPPTLEPLPNHVIDEGQTLTFNVVGSDPDGDALLYAASPLPTGSSFDASTGTFTWTPDYEAAGSYTLQLSVSDTAGLSDSDSLLITVENVNRAPHFLPVEPQHTREGLAFSLVVQAEDPDQDVLQYAATSLPAGAQFDPASRTFSWVPGFDDAGDYTLHFSATDPGQLADTLVVSLAVDNHNRAPVLAGPTSYSIEELQPLSVLLQATDPDGDALQFSVTNLPVGAAFDAVAHTLSWTPSYDQAGSYTVGITVSDGELAATGSLIITVLNVNRAPTLEPIGTLEVEAGVAVQFSLKAADPDQDPLTASVVPLPTGAQLHPTTHAFSWSPTVDQVGEHSLVFQVSDPQGLSAAQTARIVVRAVNHPPVLEVAAEYKATVGQPFTLTPKAMDPDGDVLSFSATGLPEGAGINSATGVITWTPNQTGTYSGVVIQVSDGEFTDAKTVTLIVSEKGLALGGQIVRITTHAPIAGVTVELFYKEQLIATTMTGFDGRYRFDGMTSGKYRIVPVSKGDYQYSPPARWTQLHDRDRLKLDFKGIPREPDFFRLKKTPTQQTEAKHTNAATVPKPSTPKAGKR